MLSWRHNIDNKFTQNMNIVQGYIHSCFEENECKSTHELCMNISHKLGWGTKKKIKTNNKGDYWNLALIADPIWSYIKQLDK